MAAGDSPPGDRSRRASRCFIGKRMRTTRWSERLWDKAEIDVEIEMLLRTELLELIYCDWWGEETGRVLSGNPFC